MDNFVQRQKVQSSKKRSEKDTDESAYIDLKVMKRKILDMHKDGSDSKKSYRSRGSSIDALNSRDESRG